MMKNLLTALIMCFSIAATAQPQTLTNVYGRDIQMLNGKWNIIIDPYDVGIQKQIFLNRAAQKGSDFFEYAFDGGLRLDVPGDWNSQNPELKYYEGTLWYAKHIYAGRKAPEGLCASETTVPDKSREKVFLYFGAVSYRCNVYLNGERIASHEGAFTPFQVEVTSLLKKGDNFLAVEVSNKRTPDAIPAMSYDWWNYGGITRDVMLVRVPKVHVKDYFLRLDGSTKSDLLFDVCLSDKVSEDIILNIPELGISEKLTTGTDGEAGTRIRAKGLQRWNPENPKLYDIEIVCGTDRISDRIGFRDIETKGAKILVNGKETFMRCISFHEEIPQRMSRACSREDSRQLLSAAAELGANMVRLAHYPQSEQTVRMAEEMGILLWEEIPLWQGINFSNENTYKKAENMLREMIYRDRNRCAIGFWSIANETRPSDARNSFLGRLLEVGRSLDTSRLFVAAFDNAFYMQESDLFEMDDEFAGNLDVIAINKYMGWYAEWPKDPSEIHWNIFPDKPLIISEFGGEAQYGQHGDAHWAASWSEEYQEQLYRDNLAMFRNIPNLAGISPWILYDFRSPYRFHPVNQEGWNRKGLLSDRGEKKKAWYIINEYYKQKRDE